jgi:hypothetical protein
VFRSALVGALILGVGCRASELSTAEASATRVHIPAGRFSGVAWLPQRQIVVAYWPNQGGSFGQLWKVRPDGSGFSRIPMTSDHSCGRTGFSHPTASGDGRLMFIRWCFGPGVHEFLESYDWATGESAPLLSHALPFNPHQYTLDPTMKFGFISTLSDICGTIARLDSVGVHPLPFNLTDDGRTWRLNEYFRRDPAQSCENEGRVDWPALSTDGSELAFFGSAPTPGVRDFARLNLPWSLFATDVSSWNPVRLLTGVRHPRGLAWSPDGRWLAFAGQVQGRGTGTWVFQVAGRDLIRVFDESMDAIAWSPDGRQIAGVYDPNPLSWPPEGQLLILGVADLISPDEP